MASLGTEISLDLAFDDAVEKVTDALAAEGFGVISRIDMDEKFREKLGVEFRRYVILGACNPALAHEAVSDQPQIGLMLPCNVTVEEEGAGALVRIIDPKAMMSVEGIEQTGVIRDLMTDAKERLGRAADALRMGGRSAD